MKRTVLAALIILALPVAASAQTESLLSDVRVSGGYGGPSLKLMEANGEAELMFGGQGAAVFNSKVALGGAGWGLTSGNTVTNSTGTDFEFEFSYGGLLFEYYSDPDRLLHHYYSLVAGGGTVSYRQVGGGVNGDDGFWALEPAAHVVLNFFGDFRVALGINYRLIYGFSDNVTTVCGLTKSDIDGYAISLTFRFGKY